MDPYHRLITFTEPIPQTTRRLLASTVHTISRMSEGSWYSLLTGQVRNYERLGGPQAPMTQTKIVVGGTRAYGPQQLAG